MYGTQGQAQRSQQRFVDPEHRLAGSLTSMTLSTAQLMRGLAALEVLEGPWCQER